MPDTDVIAKGWKSWPDDKRLKIRKVAWMLDVSRAHVRRLIRQGLLGATKVGHVYKVRVSDLLEYLDPNHPLSACRQKEIKGFKRKGKR